MLPAAEDVDKQYIYIYIYIAKDPTTMDIATIAVPTDTTTATSWGENSKGPGSRQLRSRVQVNKANGFKLNVKQLKPNVCEASAAAQGNGRFHCHCCRFLVFLLLLGRSSVTMLVNYYLMTDQIENKFKPNKR